MTNGISGATTGAWEEMIVGTRCVGCSRIATTYLMSSVVVSTRMSDIRDILDKHLCVGSTRDRLADYELFLHMRYMQVTKLKSLICTYHAV
jgi:hypothetical protein